MVLYVGEAGGRDFSSAPDWLQRLKEMRKSRKEEGVEEEPTGAKTS